MPKWKEFEELAAKISAQLALNSVVHSDHDLIDQTGERRQFDVIIEVPSLFRPLIVAIECKHYTRPVEVEKVEAFHTKTQDCKVNQGIMVSPRGFTRNAKKKAELHNIQLLSYRQAQESDWQKLVGPTAWLRFVQEEYQPKNIVIKTTDGRSLRVDEDAAIFAANGEMLLPAKELARQLIDRHSYLENSPEGKAKRQPGAMWLGGNINDPRGPFHIERSGEPIEFRGIVVNGTLIARMYPINMAFGSGDVLDDVLNGKNTFKELSSVPFRIQEIIRSQEGIELTPETYADMGKVMIALPHELQAENAELRISYTMSEGDEGSAS
jgi:hypothetical protein